MVEQLCYTRSAIGLSGSTEFQVRAASNGVSDINGRRFAAFDKYLRYTLPTGTERLSANIDNSPFCLAYIDAGIEPIIVHKVYTGRDAHGRPGVYFAHLLAELPGNFSVRDAIDMWNSSFWLLSESQLQAQLEAQHDSPRSVKLRTVSPDRLVQGPREKYDVSILEKHLSFMVQAFLSLEGQQKLYIAGSDIQIATLIWGLAHSLPLTMLKSLTFSTYEHDLNEATMRVVGTCRPYTSPEQRTSISRQDLPADCYSGRGLALNCYTGQTSNFSPPPALIDLQSEFASYIKFAVDCLLKGEMDELKERTDLAEKRNVDSIGSFLAIHKHLKEEGKLSPAEMTDILVQPELAIDLLSREKIQRTIINLRIQNEQWWRTSGKETIINLCEYYRLNPDKEAFSTLDAFALRLVDETCTAMLAQNNKAWSGRVSLLSALAPAESKSTYWVKLLEMLSKKTAGDPSWRPSKEYAWGDRLWFLEQWVHGYREICDQWIAPWLEGLLWEELRQVLSMNFPFNWKMLAIVAVITSPSIPVSPVAVEPRHMSLP